MGRCVPCGFAFILGCGVGRDHNLFDGGQAPAQVASEEEEASDEEAPDDLPTQPVRPNPQPSTLNPQPSTLSPEPSTLGLPQGVGFMVEGWPWRRRRPFLRRRSLLRRLFQLRQHRCCCPRVHLQSRVQGSGVRVEGGGES